MLWWSYYVSSVSSFFLFVCFLLTSFFLFFCCYNGCSYFFDWGVVSFCGVDFSFSLVFDWVSLSFSSVVLFISSFVLWFSSSYMDGDLYLRRFIYLVLLFVLSMNFLVYIPNLVALLLGWDGLGLVSFLLVIYYQNFKSLGAGMITVLANRVGDVMLLLSIGWFFSQGHWDIFSFWESFYQDWLVFCIVVAGMTKSAQIPFSSWLPAAMAAPTPVSALVHSSTLVTAGVFLLVRFFPFLSSVYWFGSFLMVISVSTMLMAGISANVEMDMKKVIALSTLSQLGVMMSSLALGFPFLTLFHLYTHALFKALLFLCAGSIINCVSHSQDFRFLGQVWCQMPVSVSCLNVANLALCGAPFLAGFYSKDLILESFLCGYGNFIILFMVFFATGLTACYSIRFSLKSLWGVFNFFPYHVVSDEDWRLVVPMLSLSLGAVFSGSFFSWFIFSSSDLIVLPVLYKFLTIFVVVLGAWFGWVFNFWGSSLDSSLVFSWRTLSFSFSFMWFLVYLASQFVISFPLKVGYGFLYLLDRGWGEVFGGQGVFFFAKSGSQFLVSTQRGFITSYLCFGFFSLFLFVLLLFIFF